MKDDAPTPNEIPRKRRELERALDRWIAVWLTRSDLTPSERRRLEEEQESRKAARGRESRIAAVVVCREGASPPQAEALMEKLSGVTEVRCAPHPPRWLKWSCSTREIPLISYEGGLRWAIQQADVLLAAPRETIPPTNLPSWERSPVWAAIGYAKHRKIAVTTIMTDGKEL